MLTEQEYAALIEVIKRAPITPGEAIALTLILEKLDPSKKPVETLSKQTRR